MTFLNVLYRNGLWISAPLFGISAAMLVFFILGLVRLGEKKLLFSVPLLEQQQVEFPEAGRVTLCLEGPRLSGRFSDLAYELLSADGTRVAGQTAWFHARRSGFSQVRMEMQSFGIPGPGRYTLRVRNLGSGRDGDDRHKIVFTKPHLVQTVGYILGIVLAAGLVIGSMVLFILRLLSKGANP